MGLSLELSNALGYAIGLLVSYITHKVWSFKSEASLKKEFPKFITAVTVGYGINILVLLICARLLSINPYISQLISGGFYVVTSFFLLKYFTFKSVAKR